MYDRKSSSRALMEVAGTNRAFLSLVTAGPDAAIRFGVGIDIAMRINALEERPLSGLAGMPFSLFSLRLHDLAAWQSVLDGRVRDTAATPNWSREGSLEHQFLIIALSGVRDIAGTDPGWASALYGIHPMLAPIISRIEISQLPTLADSARSWLRARMAGHDDWWGSLIVTACRGESHRGARELGIHKTIQTALNLRGAQLPRGRLCRRQ
jgi:hypothetical protein